MTESFAQKFGKFYKYRAFGTKGSDERQFLESIILDQKLWFATPSTLNDPRDCRPTLEFKGSSRSKRSAIIESFLRAESKRGYSLIKSERARRVAQLMRDLSNESGKADLFQPFFDEQVSVMCMSKRFDIEEQWSRYGDNHAGVCLEFEIGRDTAFEPVYEVQYRDTPPVFDLMKVFKYDPALTDELMHVVTTKRSSYATEDEVRAISIDKSGLISYPTEMLTSVIFGARTSQADVDWFLELISRCDISASVFRVERDPVSRSLNIVTL